MSDPTIFQEPEAPQVFQQPNAAGTGLKSMDTFISNRVAVMSDPADVLRNLNVAQQNVAQLGNDDLRAYVDGVSARTFNGIKIDVVNHYADKNEVDNGVQKAQEITDAAGEETEVRRLANSSAYYLDRFEKNSIPREVARRQVAALLIQKQLEQAGIDPDTLFKKIKGIATTLIPGRRIVQDVTTDYSISDTVKNLHRMNDQDFIKALPDAMDQIQKMSGDNPFYFMERMQAYLDPGDVAYLKALFAQDAVDVATSLAGVTKFLKLANFTRAANTPIKILRDSGEVKKAAEINAAALSDKGAAESAQTTQIDAAMSTSPFGGEGVDPSVTDRLAPETQAIIAERTQATREILQPLHDQNFFLKKQYWDPELVAQREEKFLTQYAGSARVISRDENGFDAEVSIQRPSIWPKADVIEQTLTELRDTKKAYKEALKNTKDKSTGQPAFLKEKIDETRDQINRYEAILERVKGRPDGPTPVEVQKVRVQYGDNEFGELQATQFSKAFRFINSPSTYIDQMLKNATNDATQLGFQSDRALDVLMRARNVALKGLNKSAKRDLDSILLQGDRDQVAYGDMDLVNGVRTPDGIVKLKSAEQVAAYRSVRESFDFLYELKNRELARQLELGGFNAIFPEVEGEVQTNFVNTRRIIPVEERAGIKRLFNMESGKVENAEDSVKFLEEHQVGNAEIYKLKYPMNFEDEVVEYALAKPSKIKPLPRYVLDKRVGYVPKIDKNVFWVAEMVGPKTVNGNIQKAYRTVVRYFDNPLDANDWKAAQRAKGQDIDIRSGREWVDAEPGRREQFEADIFGGLYGGKRGSGPVPFGIEGTEAERLGGIEAMEAYMNHIATRLPAVEFRQGLVQKFLNSAVDPRTGASLLENPGEWRSAISKNVKTTDPEMYKGLKAMQDWISDQVRIPTTEERIWGDAQQWIARTVVKVPGTGKTLARWAMNIGAKDVTAQLRGLSFHATLGWFNPRQLFVQAMGASTAMSLDPIRAPIIIGKSLALRMAMWAKSEQAIKTIAKAAYLNEDEFLSMVKAYQRTGLHEATLSTGDWAAINGIPHGMETLRYIANKGLMFFKEGERFARNYAWIQAWDELSKGRKGLAVTDEFIGKVTDLHLKYTLNLNRANRARWQKGLLSVPTQFWQISAKFMENILPGVIMKNPNGWTGKEKSFILLGQLALFGAAGVPYGRSMANSLTEWLKSKDDFGLGIDDPEQLTAIQGGLTELMLYNWTGERLDVTNAISIPAGVEQMVEIMKSEQKSTADLIMGVSGELGSRTWDAIKLNSSILHSVVKNPEDFDADVAVQVIDNVAQIASSWRNYQKARLWERLHYIPDRNGGKIIDIDDKDNRALLIAQKLGIPPKKLTEYYDIKESNKSVDADYRDAAVGIIQIGQRYMNDPDMLTNTKKQQRMETEIMLAVAGFTDEEKEKIMDQVNERMKKDDYRLPQEMEKALDNMYNKHGASDLQNNATMIEAN